MIYEWDEKLETGNEEIDNQHKQLIGMLNHLIIAHEEKKGPQELDRALHFLTAYTVLHFQDEEDLQKQYDYPEYEQHRSIHNDFKFVVKDLTDQLSQEGYTDALMEKTINIISGWLLNHIKGDDLKLAEYIRQIEKRQRYI